MNFFIGFPAALHAATAQGILWAIMAVGVYITFRILDYADMTVDGSFALGGAVCTLLITKNVHPLLTVFAAAAAGTLAGLATGLMNTKLKIPTLLAGILTMIALYSINIRVMGNKNMITLLRQETLQTKLYKWLPLSRYNLSLLLGGLFCAALILILYWFFGTEVGSAIRATGNNPNMVRALGGNTDTMKILGLMMGNALVAMSGALVAQDQGYADVGMGTGAIVIGLASIIIGEVIMGKRFNFAYLLLSVIVGSLLYRIIIALVLQMGLSPTDLKLLTALIVALALSLPVIKEKFLKRKNGVKSAFKTARQTDDTILEETD